MIVLDIENPHGFAIDWISGNMYFSSYTSTRTSISVAKLNGVYRTELLNNHMVSVSLKKPTSMVLHPTLRSVGKCNLLIKNYFRG